jgi:hypothetical protein
MLAPPDARLVVNSEQTVLAQLLVAKEFQLAAVLTTAHAAGRPVERSPPPEQESELETEQDLQ